MYTKGFVILTLAFIASSLSTTLVDEQKPFDCPPNEKYYKCHLEVCFKTCEHLVHVPPCPAIAAGCYAPACVCVENYLRNENGVCVPVDECPKPGK